MTPDDPHDDPSDDVESLVGIGPASAGWLRDAGVRTRGDLASVGPAEAYRRVLAGRPGVSLNLLWALRGGLDGLHWTMVPPAVRDDLRRQVDAAGEGTP